MSLNILMLSFSFTYSFALFWTTPSYYVSYRRTFSCSSFWRRISSPYSETMSRKRILPRQPYAVSDVAVHFNAFLFRCIFSPCSKTTPHKSKTKTKTNKIKNVVAWAICAKTDAVEHLNVIFMGLFCFSLFWNNAMNRSCQLCKDWSCWQQVSDSLKIYIYFSPNLVIRSHVGFGERPGPPVGAEIL